MGPTPSGMELFLLLLPMVALPSTEATCLGPMARKPEFIAAPRVMLTSLNSVRVIWDNLVDHLDCAEQFKVMWWVEGTLPTGLQSPASELLSSDQNKYTVQNLTQRTKYVVKVMARDKRFSGAHWHDSPPTHFTTSPQDCSQFTEDNLPHPRFLLLGPTGVGKSTFGNLLLGGNVHAEQTEETAFRMGHDAWAQTTDITHQVGNWLGYGPCFTIIDTPGTSDGEGRDYKNAIDMANIMNKKFKTISVFLLLANGKTTRFDQSMIDLLRLYHSIFGDGMWSNSVTEVTHWSHTRRAVRRREKKHQDDQSRHEQWNQMYQDKLEIPSNLPIPSVYIDPVYPIFSEDEFDIEEMEDDPEERRIFDKYTDLLWGIATEKTPFACDGKCTAPSGYFIGEPWMAVTSPHEKEENETSFAVRAGERASLTCRIWIGTNSASTTSDNVTITVGGTEVYKKETDPDTGDTHESHLDQDPRFNIRVEEDASATGHFSEFKIDIASFGEGIVGNVTCDNGVPSNNSAVALVLRVDCSYGNWSSWSTCSKSCLASDGIQGQKERTRTSFPPQNGGNPCTESQRDVKACAGGGDGRVVLCPVNHTLKSWNSWSDCSAKCGPGKQDRTRSCIQGINGGTQCPADFVSLIKKETRECKIKECPACIVEQWQPWSSCSKTCLPKSGGPGIRRRTRAHHEADKDSPRCLKKDIEEVQKCAFNQCPVNHILTEWTTWSPCSPNCGPGKQDRSRSCTQGIHGGTQCPKHMVNLIEKVTRVCKIKECAACNVEQWQPWSSCSKTCMPKSGGPGTRRRKRIYHEADPSNPKCVKEENEEDENCAFNQCPVNHILTEWTTWSSCSPNCGPGKQDRSRSCTQGIHGGTQCPKHMENLIEKGTRGCKIKECPACNFEEWQTWSPCTKTCLPTSGDPGTRRRTRNYHEADPFSPMCVKEENEEDENCAFNQCPVDAKMGPWTSWGPPAAVCGVHCKRGANATRTPIMQTRMRPCIEGLHGGQTCENLLGNTKGFEEQERMCPTSKPCPEDCILSSWGEWSKCSSMCKPGTMQRQRSLHGPFYGGKDCKVPGSQFFPTTVDDTRCQRQAQNYKVKHVITTIAYVGSWPECLQKCLAEDTCNHWVKYTNNKCELVSSYTSPYNDTSVEVSGPKACTYSFNREKKWCSVGGCSRCNFGSWGSWSACGYCTSSSGNYQYRSRSMSMPTGKIEFNGVTLKCEGYDTQRADCHGSFWYWTVAVVSVGVANLAAC